MSVEGIDIPLPVRDVALPELDLEETAAAADSSAASACRGGSPSDDGERSRTLKSLDRPVQAPSCRAGAPCGSRPETSDGSERRRHLRSSSLVKEDFIGQGSAEAFSTLSLPEPKDASTGKPEHCHPSQVTVSRAALMERYARSKAGWISKERSTPEGYNRAEHAWRFESHYPSGMSASSIVDAYMDAFAAPVVVRPPKKKNSPEERKAIREKKIMQSERASVHDVETALRKYNRANNTWFKLVEITVKCLFFEFGGPCYHYNFTAKLANDSTGGGAMLFFSEINFPLQSEDDVLLCCMVGEKDKGHCHACVNYRPMMIHPSRVVVILQPSIILIVTAQALIVTIKHLEAGLNPVNHLVMMVSLIFWQDSDP